MANKLLDSIKGISPKGWLIMGGGLLVMIFISRSKGGNVTPLAASSGDSTVNRDAINQVQASVKNSNASLNEAMTKQSATFKEELAKQAEESGKMILTLKDSMAAQSAAQSAAQAAQAESTSKLFGSLTENFSKSLEVLKGDISNVNQQLQKQPDYSTKFNEYDKTLSGLNSSLASLGQLLNGAIGKMNQPTNFNGGYSNGGGTYTSPTSTSTSSNTLPSGLQSEISAPTKLGSSPNTWQAEPTKSNPWSNSSSQSDVLSQIKHNADAWQGASPAEQQKLHDENIKLGASIGATYTSDGNWTKNGTIIN